MERDRGERDAARREIARPTRRVNGRAALGISALPGSRAKTVWYASMPGRRGVAISDRPAVAGEVPLDGHPARQQREASRRAAHVGRQRTRRAPPPGRSIRVARPRRRGANRPASAARRPTPVRVTGVDRWSSISAPLGARRYGRGQRRRGVHDQHVARLGTRRARRSTRRARRRSFVTQEVRRRHVRPGRRRELVRGEAVGGLRRSPRHLRDLARPVAAAGRSPSIRASRPGTLSSGGGRSEMSSPGKASWCICVRMSPGSTQYTRSPGCSAREDRGELLERRLRRAVAAPALVGLDARIGGDVQHRGALGQPRQRELQQRERRDHVRLVDLAERVERVVGERGHRARPEQARVVHEQVDAVAGRLHQRAPVARRRRCRRVSRSRDPRSAAASASASAPRASTTRSQPRSSSARASASPSPRDAPVTIPTGMRRMMHLQVHLKSSPSH